MKFERSKTIKEPLLLFKVGIPGSETRGSIRVLAQELGFEYLSIRDMKHALLQERAKRGEPSRRWHGTDASAYLAPLLLRGRDVVLDASFNSPNTRQQVPLAQAREAGALTVALNMVTPADATADRLGRFVSDGYMKLSLGKKEDIPPDTYVAMALRGLVRPQPDEGIDAVIRVDGKGNTDDFLTQVFRGLEANRLGKYIPDPEMI